MRQWRSRQLKQRHSQQTVEEMIEVIAYEAMSYKVTAYQAADDV
jgi:hypothetical protein